MENIQEIEKKILDYWNQIKAFNKSVEQRPKNKQYVFYDGPPFATGLPHYGHILGMTSKDVFPRYWTMKGFRVERVWGWDCHGLPIENIAEKALGIKEKKQIEEMGVKKFNDFCRKEVLTFVSEWKKTVSRMGKWIEFDNSYKTMDNSYMESVWWSFKELYNQKLIYEGKKVLLYCARCETPLANAEVAMDNSYKDVVDKSVFVKFKLINEENTYLTAWSTTPWTILGNVALAVNSDLNYVKIKLNDEFLILAEERLSVIKDEYTIVEKFKGKELLDKKYEPLFNLDYDGKKGHYVINGKENVSSEEGTGIVHMAIYGEFDYEMIKKYNLPVIQHVGHNGKLELGPKEWVGTWFKKLDKLVTDDLENRNLLFKAEDFTHPYPFCYRCDTPLFYNAMNSWFVDIQKIKSKLIKLSAKINWYPNHFKEGRFKNVLETAPDWTISRNRYWATSIPVWKCTKCKHLEVLGSVKELKEKSIEKISNDIDLHKHVVDEIHLKCIKCKTQMDRIPEVIDCWFESGSMPFAATHYPFEKKKEFEENFPCDFVSEYTGQVRTWFYYMHVLGTTLFNNIPFKNVIVSGTILAADGSKMSKSKKNYPDPNMIFEKYGADALRFYLMGSPLMRAEDLNFKEDSVKEVYRRVVLLLTNIKNFYNLFSDTEFKESSKSDNILDKWIISKLNLLIKNGTFYMDDYDTITFCKELVAFIEELSTWYVRRSRDRFKEEDIKVKKQALETLSYVLLNLSKLLAPISPFISEFIYRDLRKNDKNLLESVHLDLWPKFSDKLIDLKLNSNMDLVRELVNKALDEREKVKIPIKQPLSKLKLNKKLFEKELSEEYLGLIKDEINVKDIEITKNINSDMELDTKITDELLEEGISRELIRIINQFRKELNLTINDRVSLNLQTKDNLILNSLNKFKSEIMKSVQADKIEEKIDKNFKTKDVEIKNSKLTISLKIL